MVMFEFFNFILFVLLLTLKPKILTIFKIAWPPFKREIKTDGGEIKGNILVHKQFQIISSSIGF